MEGRLTGVAVEHLGGLARKNGLDILGRLGVECPVNFGQQGRLGSTGGGRLSCFFCPRAASIQGRWSRGDHRRRVQRGGPRMPVNGRLVGLCPHGTGLVPGLCGRKCRGGKRPARIPVMAAGAGRGAASRLALLRWNRRGGVEVERPRGRCWERVRCGCCAEEGRTCLAYRRHVWRRIRQRTGRGSVLLNTARTESRKEKECA